MVRIGLISDTHGLLRPQAMAALRDSDFIVHGGDIGNAQILDQLGTIAPVTAVRGNNDRGEWAKAIPDTAILEVGELHIHVLHDLHDLAIDPATTGVRVVVSGHSHRPQARERGRVLFVNPGSAGPRRFKLPVTVAQLRIVGGEVSAHIVDLEV